MWLTELSVVVLLLLCCRYGIYTYPSGSRYCGQFKQARALPCFIVCLASHRLCYLAFGVSCWCDWFPVWSGLCVLLLTIWMLVRALPRCQRAIAWGVMLLRSPL